MMTVESQFRIAVTTPNIIGQYRCSARHGGGRRHYLTARALMLKALVVIVTVTWATQILAGARPDRSTIVYASQAGAALDSDLLKGGGTDDTVVLQRLLDRAKDGRGVHLIVDGPALISGLEVHSHTTIECTAGGGFYLTNNTARAIIRNAHRSRDAVTDTNITLRGCTFNGNRKNQIVAGPAHSVLRLSQEPDGTFRSGLQFFGVNNLTIEDSILSDIYSWGIWVANAKLIHVSNVTVRREVPPFPEGGDIQRIRAWYEENGKDTVRWGGNDDGMHFSGPIQYLTIDGARLATWDDGISLTANDHDTDDLTINNVLGPYVGQGPITDVTISNVIFMGAHHGIRMLSGNQRLDRVLVSNVTGTIRERFAVISPYKTPSRGNFGSITFSNVNVELEKYPPWAELYPEKGWQRDLDDQYSMLAAGKRPKSDRGEEREIPLFSLNGQIENLNLYGIAVKVAGRDRPLIRVGHNSDIQVMNVDMSVRDPEAQAIPLKLMGKIERLNFRLDWKGRNPIQYKGGQISQLNWLHGNGGSTSDKATEQSN